MKFAEKFAAGEQDAAKEAVVFLMCTELGAGLAEGERRI
jgi:hypothetical protein